MRAEQKNFLIKMGIVSGAATVVALVSWLSVVAADRQELREFPKDKKTKCDTMIVLDIQYRPKREKNTCYIMDDEKHGRLLVMPAASDIKSPFVRQMDSVVVKTTKRPCGLLSRKIIENLTTGAKLKEYQPQR